LATKAGFGKFSRMQNEALLIIRFVASAVFLGALCTGFYLLKNYHRLFGTDADMPSEGPSSRAYSQLQVFVILAHVLVASGAFALMLH
jgi:hypothetical protein